VTVSARILRTILGLAVSTTSFSSAFAQGASSSFVDVVRPTEVKAGLEVLNGYLKPLSPAIETTGCDLLIERHPGRVEEIFAGICRLKSGAHVMVCGDTGVGEFGLTPWRGGVTPPTRDLLVRFTNANCPGG
jgi:hypothetical protein